MFAAMTDDSENTNVDFADAITGQNLRTGKLQNSNHGEQLKSEHPVDNADDLIKRAHQQGALRKANLYGTDWGDEKKETYFDETILDFAIKTLEVSGIDENEISTRASEITVPRVRVLLLIEARVSSPAQLHRRYDNLSDEINVDGALSRASLYRCREEMKKDEELWTSFKQAVARAFYAYYRMGGPIPNSVHEAHTDKKPAYSPLTKEKFALDGKVPNEERVEAICNWCELLLPICLEPISFNRGDNTQYNKYSLLGALAHAALIPGSVNEIERRLIGWHYDSDLVSSGDNILRHIEKLDIDTISNMFLNANEEFFKIADEHINFPPRVRIAYDPTYILWEDDQGRDVKVGRWMKGFSPSVKSNVKQSDAGYKWDFGAVSMIESSQQFCLGVYPVGNDVRDGDVIERLLRESYHKFPFEIDQLVMDRGMVSADVVDHVRNVFGDNWLLLAKQQHVLKEIVDETPEQEINFVENIDYLQELTERPNAIVVPIKDEQETDDTQRVFLTDLDLDEIDPSSLNYQYRRRKRIESSIGIIKEMMPETRSSKIEVRYFLLSLGILFHNCLKLMNESLSPKHALPLGSGEHNRVLMDEVLLGIQSVCFQLAEDEAN